MQLVVATATADDGRYVGGGNDQTGLVKLGLGEYPRHCHHESRRSRDETRSVDIDVPSAVWLVELDSLHLYSHSASSGQAPRNLLNYLAVRKWTEQAAVAQRCESPAHLLLTQETDDPISVGYRRQGSHRCQRRRVIGPKSLCQASQWDQVLTPLVALPGGHRHVDDKGDPASIVDPGGLPFQGGGVGDQSILTKTLAFEKHPDHDLVRSKQMVLVQRDRCLAIAHSGLCLHLNWHISPVVEPMYQTVDAAVEQRKEDVESAAGLADESCPHEKLSGLPDGVVGAMGPRASARIGHFVRVTPRIQRLPEPTLIAKRDESHVWS